MMKIQKYVRPKTLEEAYELNQNRRNHLIAGMMWSRLCGKNVNTAIDLCELGLDTIEENEEEISIGAMVTLRQLEQHKGLAGYSGGAVERAVRDIVGVQFRNMATAGGSIWGRYGFSDVLTVFLSMDSYVELYRGGTVSMEKFSKMPYDRDILKRIIIKKRPGEFSYQTVRNQRTDFPVLTCAVSEIDGKYRAVIGARPGKAVVIRDEAELLKEGIDEKSAEKFAGFVAEHTKTGSNLRAGAEYRSHLAKVLVNRCLLSLGGKP